MDCGIRRRAPGLRIKTENKGLAGSQAQTAPARKSRRLSLVSGEAATAYTHHSVLGAPENCGRGECFFMGC